MTQHTPRIGLAMGYDAALDVKQMADNARAAEERGFDMAFFSETLFTNRDSVSTMAGFALRTESISIGTTQVVKLRSPLVMAQSAATLDELSGGRLVLVIGAYTAKHAGRNGVPLTDPVTTLREYIDCVRALLRGERVDYRGEVVEMEGASLNFTPLRADIPIWIAAASKKGLSNVAALGDGVLLDAGTSPEYSANAIRLVHEGCERDGRDPAELTVAQLINTSIEQQAADAVEAIRWEVATKFTYSSTPRAKLTVGEPTIDRADLPRFEAAFAAGGKEALARILPERYVTSLTATGTAADARARVEDYRAAGVDLPLVRPARASQLPALLDAFGSRRGATGSSTLQQR